jgi:hypothetical protein
VVNLFNADARGHHDIFHSGSVLDSHRGIEIKRLDKDATAPLRQSRTHEGARIVSRQQTSLEAGASG